jgi:hypothetical protein
VSPVCFERFCRQAFYIGNQLIFAWPTTAARLSSPIWRVLKISATCYVITILAEGTTIEI